MALTSCVTGIIDNPSGERAGRDGGGSEVDASAACPGGCDGGPDAAAGPAIADVAAFDIRARAAKVRWTTDQLAAGQVEYGPTTAYGQRSAREESFQLREQVHELVDLSPDTEYHFRVWARNRAGIESVSDDHAFTTAAAPSSGPLRVHPTNGRYFTDGSGKAIYLTGSHTWDAFQSWFEGEPGAGGIGAGKPDSFAAYLDVLENNGHNFVRLWVADTAWSPITGAAIEPQPYLRTGPGMAADGRPRFDLDRFNPAFFDTLRAQVVAAQARGIYVSVMLFDGWGISEYRAPRFDTTWDYHPFAAGNNVNGVDGDANRDGIGLEFHTRPGNASIAARQEAYVRHVVDTVNDLDNVLYEICNESGDYSTAWQVHLIEFIKAYEATKPKQHPVGMTFQFSGTGDTGTNATLFASPADWISPGPSGGYWDNPPAADGRKVMVPDTDHLRSMSSDATWVWRSFMRGHNPIVMDWWNGTHWDQIRRTMGYTRAFAERMELASMSPRNGLATTEYCLANPGSEYLIYQPASGAFRATLEAGTYAAEWFNPATGATAAAGSVEGGGSIDFAPPFGGAALLYLRRTR